VKKTLVVLWLCAVVVAEAAKIKTQAQGDPVFDFRPIKTWAWDPAGGGDVLLARAADDDPAVVKRRVDPVITAAVERELAGRGLTKVTTGAPDITMHYYLLVTVGFDTQTMGQFLPAVPMWGVPPFAPATSSLNIIQRGSIVLDAVSTSLARVIWRGVAQTDIDKIKNDAERDGIIRDSVRDLVKKLPLKK
jgi:hypothetical protein